MALEIVHTPSYKQNSLPSGSPILNFIKNILVLLQAGAEARFYGVAFRKHLFGFLISDLIHRRISPIEFYHYVCYSLQATRHLEAHFLYKNLRRLSGCRHYLDVSSPRVFPYFLFHYLPLEDATFSNPDVTDLLISQRSLGHGRENTTFLSLRLEEIAKVEKYDLITSVSVVEHIAPEDTANFMKDILALLVPGGLCLLTFPCAYSEIIEYRDIDPYTTQEFDEKQGAYFFQKYFTPELVACEILPGFEIVSSMLFGEGEKGQYWEYERRGAKVQSYSSSTDHKVVSNMFTEYQSMDAMAGVGVCCYLLRKIMIVS